MVDFATELLITLKHTENKIQYEKFFDEEIITKVKLEIKLKRDKYFLTLSRDTFGDKILIGCEISTTENNITLFGTAYDLKIIAIELFNRTCSNSNIFLLQDYNNELICQSAYIEIHKIENRFRNILTRYLMKKYGKLLLSKSLKKDVDDYSKWFKKEVKSKYKTFKRINTDYCNLDFSKLPKVLDLKDSQCVGEDGTSAVSEVELLENLLDDDANMDDVLKQIAKVHGQINSRANIFDDKPSKAEKDEAVQIFGTAEILKSEDLRDILDKEFRTIWENDLSKMRNMVAHNKPICKELHDDIISTCQTINTKFDKCIEYIENEFYSDEEGVRSALEDMEIEAAIQEHYYIEQEREAVGIEFSLSESVIETIITENLKSIQNLMSIIGKLSDMRNIIEEISGFIYEYLYIDVDEIDEVFKKNVFEIMKEELDLDVNYNTFKELSADKYNEIINNILFKGIDMEKAIDFYTDDEKYPYINMNFDYFNMDFKVSWYGLDNKVYEITFDGILSPENAGIDDLEFKLYVDNHISKSYYIRIDYGDYTNQSEGYVDDTQVEYLIEEIEDLINSTVDRFKKINEVASRLMDLL